MYYSYIFIVLFLTLVSINAQKVEIMKFKIKNLALAFTIFLTTWSCQDESSEEPIPEIDSEFTSIEQLEHIPEPIRLTLEILAAESYQTELLSAFLYTGINDPNKEVVKRVGKDTYLSSINESFLENDSNPNARTRCNDGRWEESYRDGGGNLRWGIIAWDCPEYSTEPLPYIAVIEYRSDPDEEGGSSGGTDSGGGTGTLPPPDKTEIFTLGSELEMKLFSLEMHLSLTGEEDQFLRENPTLIDEVYDFLTESNSSEGSKNLASKAINALRNGGTVDFDERLVYEPTLDQDYKNRMAEQEKEIFEELSAAQKTAYLMSAQQAWNYADSYYGDTFYNGLGDAVRHSFWNALSTVRLSEDLTKQLTDAHETKPATYEFSHKEVEMDLHNNAEGRLIAFMAGRLYLLIENALSTGELRYLTNLTGPLAPKQGRATSASQLIPTKE